MKLALMSAFLALPLAAQPSVGCKVSFGSSSVMRDLYGGKVSVIQGRVNCQNFGIAASSISGVTIDYSLPTVNTVPAGDASAMLTKTYNNQPGKRISRDLTTGLGAFGALEAAKTISIGAGPAGIVVAAIVTAIQYIIPSFTANEPALNLSNQCDNIAGITLAAGQTLTCTIYIRKPGKGDPPLPAAFQFAINAALPGTVTTPIAPPVSLRPPAPRASFEGPAPTDGAVVASDASGWASAEETYELAREHALTIKILKAHADALAAVEAR